MNHFIKSVFVVGAPLFVLIWGAPTFAAANKAGSITLLTGKGTAINEEGEIRQLTRGGPVYSGEILNSGPGSFINVKFEDGGRILLRPKSRFQIEKYAFKAETKKVPARAGVRAPKKETIVENVRESSAFFRLLKGGFRAVSGAIGKIQSANYRVKTPVATIGIRGTDYELYICDDICRGDPVLRAVLPEGSSTDGNLVVIGHEGTITVSRIVENAETGDVTDVNAGDNLAVTVETVVKLKEKPVFLQEDSTPDPLQCEEQ